MWVLNSEHNKSTPISRENLSRNVIPLMSCPQASLIVSWFAWCCGNVAEKKRSLLTYVPALFGKCVGAWGLDNSPSQPLQLTVNKLLSLFFCGVFGDGNTGTQKSTIH